MYVTCQPCAALASHVERLWCCDGHPGVNGKDRALPDGRFQLAFSLAEGPISALADPMGDGGGIAPSLLIGIRSRFSIIDTAKLRSAMGVVFRPGGVRAFLKMPADAFHDKNVSLDLIWGSMVQTLRDRLRSANDPAKKFQILEVALLSRINERVQLNTAVRYALVEFDRRPQIPMVRELAHEAGLSRRRFAQLFREQIGLAPKLYCRPIWLMNFVISPGSRQAHIWRAAIAPRVTLPSIDQPWLVPIFTRQHPGFLRSCESVCHIENGGNET